MGQIDQKMVQTSHGRVCVEHHDGPGLPVLCLHGNSSSRAVFARQVQGALGSRHRLITLDLPGHGASEDARDPTRTYTRPGLADAIMEVLEALEIRQLAIIGWSLGGHLALELMSRPVDVKGVVATGTPPTRHGAMSEGFKGSPPSGAAGKKDLSPAEIEGFAATIFGDPPPDFLVEAIARTDGRFRERLFQAAREGAGVDQRDLVASSPVPIAVVNGAFDPLINLDYINAVPFANLWEGRQHRLPGGHAVFWSAAEAFNALTSRFLADIESGAA
ncbi:alpha/beta fold hydrolase [Caulobacter segnis]